MTMRLVDDRDVAWTTGAEVIATMAPRWREHLGPPDVVDAAYRLYRQKNYALEPTTRRFDVIRCEAGYADATAAYHDTVEESLILEGTCIIDGEGVFEAGDYFWRPPGWVHRSRTDVGFTALLSLEGVNPAEGSSGASRVVRTQQLAGHRADGHLGTTGGRDRVLRLGIDQVAPLGADVVPLPWAGGTTADVRVLSSHAVSRAATVIIDLPDGATLDGVPAGGLASQAYVMSGRLLADGRELATGCYLALDPEDAVAVTAIGATRLFVKTHVPVGTSTVGPEEAHDA